MQTDKLKTTDCDNSKNPLRHDEERQAPIVKKIVDLHNGQIKIDSKESSGTTVLITLPV